MIIELDCDLLEAPIKAIGHFCNCQHVMGGGIALRIRTDYPVAYKVDCVNTKQGDRSKMGTFSHAIADDGKYIINCYTQFYYGMDKRHTDYEAVYNSLFSVEKFLMSESVETFGLPKNAGCRLGGGDWTIVRSIIDSIFNNSPISLFICNYEPK